MALVKCPECGKMVSERAEMCPGCGCPTSLFEEQEAKTEEIRQQKEEEDRRRDELLRQNQLKEKRERVEKEKKTEVRDTLS